MKLEVAKTDLRSLRDELFYRAVSIKSLPAYKQLSVHHGLRERVAMLRKMIRKLNLMLKEVHGHDCDGAYYEEL